MNTQSDPAIARIRMLAVIAVALGAVALGGCASSGVEAEPTTDTTAVSADPPEALATVALAAVNDSAQAGEATIARAGDGVDLTVRVPAQDLPQYALIVAGTCADPGAPLTGIAGTSNDLVGERSGSFAESRPIDYADAKPITIERLRGSPFAILVVDASYRGGGAAEIPEGTVVYQAADREGPFGEVPLPVAACGELPAG